MNRRITCLLLVLTLVIAVGTGCNDLSHVDLPPEDSGDAGELGPITVTHNGINVTIDPRVELMAVVQYISDYHINMTSVHFLFRPAVERFFEELCEHKAVKMYEEMGPEGFTHHVPASFALSLTQDLEWDESVQLDAEILQRGGGEENLREFAAALKDFSAGSNFPGFFASHRDFYTQSVQEIVTRIGENDYISEVQTYSGLEYDSYTILPVILYRNGAHYAVQISRDEKLNAYNIIPPVRRSGNDTMAYVDEPIFRSWQRHDFSLNFVNRITETYKDEIMQYEHLYIPIKDETERLNSRTWYTFAKEHIARAISTRLAYAESQEAGDCALAEELRQGFVYIEPLLEKLEEYENNRETYPDLAAFYPELLRAFAEIE